MRLPLAVLALALLLPSLAQAATPRFTLDLYGGIAEAGRVYSAYHDGDSRSWTGPGGSVEHEGQELRAEVEPQLYLGLGVEIPRGDRLRWNARLAMADLDLVAQVRRFGGGVEDLPWDQLFLFTADVGASYDLVAGDGDTPYVLGGVGVISVGSEGTTLDQARPTFTAGAGYRFDRYEGYVLRVEARASWFPWDLGAEEERLDADRFDGAGSGLLWQLSVSVGYPFRGAPARGR